MLRAFTLIELLAVVTIIGLAAAALTAQLANAQSQADFRGAVSSWQSMETRARLLARTGGSLLRLELLEAGSETALSRMRLVDPGPGEILSVIEMARGVSVRLDRPFNQRVIPFDATGRTMDYKIVFSNGEKQEQWQVLGITGVTVRLKTGGAP